MREAIVRKLLTGGLAVGAGTTEVSDAGPIQLDTPVGAVIVYVISNASQTTGKVTLETSHSTSYTQTWIAEAVVTCATANTLQVVSFTAGERMAVRARISQTANGSGIDVVMKAS